ncbi:MAG: AAA domain-containing protein [Gemmataceae bacterium]
MPTPSIALPVLSTAALRVSPTDVSQFVRLEQCERFLRLKLAERAGQRFMEPYDVTPQRLAPLMSMTGNAFEDQVEGDLRGRFRVVNYAARDNYDHNRPANNTDMAREAAALAPGAAVVLLQTRLDVELGGWQVRGDADLVKLTRAADGALHVLVGDMKSTAEVKVEHRLQVAFYHQMIGAVLAAGGVAAAERRTGILFHPPVDPTPEEAAAAAPLAAAGRAEFALDGVLLEVVADQDAYERAAHDLVLGADSAARRVATAPFADLPFCLSAKCDGCLYAEFCMKWSAEAEDLSLLPYLTGTEKEALRRGGVGTVGELAALKDFEAAGATDLVAAPGREAAVKRLAATWPVGPRLDELVHRARMFRRSAKKDGTAALPFIPDKGNSTLPVARPDLNPNLVWLYLDAQRDPLEGRVYLLGARVVACARGNAAEGRTVVRLTPGPPDTAAMERDLFVTWTRDLLRAVVEAARSDAEPKAAPLHVVFFDRGAQQVLLEALARNFPAVLGHTPPLYDFLTQIAAFDSPVSSFLADEVRAFKNYPMTCQSLQSLAAYLKFDWSTPHPFRELFRARVFDYLGKLDVDGGSEWYTKRARFGSGIPAEYAYAAWGALPRPDPGAHDDFKDYRPVTVDQLVAFEARRLEAMEHVARRLSGNPNTAKTPFTLPTLADYEDKARDLAGALDEFVRIERLASLADWKSARHAQPEPRVLAGECLLVSYHEADQPPEVAEQNRENERRRLRREAFKAAFDAANTGKKIKYPDDCKWSCEGLTLKLRVETTGVDCDLHEILLLSTIRDCAAVVLCPRLTVDERLPEAERTEFTPTPKQMLYGQRATLTRVTVTATDAAGRATAVVAEVVLQESRGSEHTSPFVFGAFSRPLHDGRLYTLDPCPNEWYTYWCAKVVEGLCDGSPNALYDRLVTPLPPGDGAGSAAQQAFLAGLDAFRAAGHLHAFDPHQSDYIGGHAATPVLLVQGPPGTGKSYSTAFAVFARIQGAMAAGRPLRAFLTCKTHAATDVLLANVLKVQRTLRDLRATDRKLFDRHFDKRLLDVPLYRVGPKEPPPEGVIPLAKDDDKAKGEAFNADAVREHDWAVVGVTPGGTYGMLKKRWSKELFGHELCDLLVLDEASQMNLPEALMAALPLVAGAPVVVVGDHRQMPPIVKHDWDAEARRTFRQYEAYRSLFDTLRLQPTPPPIIRFAESFRLHGAMAKFLCREVYRHDGIDYHSKRADVLAAHPHADAFVAAVLDPAYPLVVVVHDEAASQVRNPFEQALITPVLRALADKAAYGLEPADGLGVVVPHRAQRAALQQAFPELNVLDAATGRPARSAVDTVERFQGGERTVVLVSATESDRGYLLASAGFLLDPRRLTVAVSRAKQKMILVASQSVFSLFSPDAETFANALLWKNLLARTCVSPLWAGAREGVPVAVWGGR